MALPPQRLFGSWVASLSLLAIVAATLLPQREAAGLGGFWCILCGDLGPVDFLLNVLLFAPLGFGLVLAGLSRWRVAVLSLAITVTIEVLQWRAIPGRDATLGDVVANMVGAWLGIVLATSWRRLLFPAPPRAFRLGLAALGAWVAVVALGAVGVRPAPTDEAFFAQRAPRLAHLAIFRGEVIEAVIGDRERPSGPMPDRDRVAEMMRSGLTVEARVILSDETPGPAPIVSVFDGRKHEILLLGQEHADAIFRARLRATDLGLRSPAVRLRRELLGRDSSGDDTTAIHGVVDQRRLTVSVVRDSRRAQAHLLLTAGLGWTFIFPTDVALDACALWLNALWLAALIIPAGYWLSWSVAPSRRSALPIAITLVAIGAAALVVLPAAMHAAPSRDVEWIGAVVGAGTGWAIGMRLRRATGAREREAMSEPERR